MLYLLSHLPALERSLLATRVRTVRLGQQPRETQAHRQSAWDYPSVSVSHITHLLPTADEQKWGPPSKQLLQASLLSSRVYIHLWTSFFLFVLCLLFVYLHVFTHMSTYHSGHRVVREQLAVNSSVQHLEPRYGTQAARLGHRCLYPSQQPSPFPSQNESFSWSFHMTTELMLREEH